MNNFVALGLLFGGFGMILLSQWIARTAWPKFKNLERRGVLKRPVPDIESMGNTNSMGKFTLMWATRIPEDRPQLRRMVLWYRACQILGMVAMLASIIAVRSGTAPWRAEHVPPPVTLTIPVQDQ